MSEQDIQEKANVALGVFIFIGANVGITIGISMDNLAVGLLLGVMLGTLLGLLARNKVLGKTSPDDTSPDDDDS